MKSNILSCVATVFLATSVSASIWAHVAEPAAAGLVRRQQAETSASAASTSTSSTQTSASASASHSTFELGQSSSIQASSGSISASSGSGGATSGRNTTSSHATKTSAIDPRLPPGGISMLTPAATDGVQYYMVGQTVTFGWNYTSLSVTPTAIDILASCSLNQATYTLALNQTVEPTGTFTWDTGGTDATASQPFPVASYTLIIYDAAEAVTAVPSAGYLAPYEQFVFGMYTNQPYQDVGEFKCVSCSGAISLHEKQALSVLLGTCVLTVLSFTYFAAGFGAFA